MRDEAWDTFQVSCNEFRSTICKVCTGKNQFGTRMTCRGTHQGMPWAAHGLPWHTPRHVMAAHGWPWHTSLLLALATHGLAMAHTKACLGTPWPGRGTHQGMPWQAMAHTKAFFEAILGVWTRYFAHMLRKIIPSSLPSFTFFGKN